MQKRPLLKELIAKLGPDTPQPRSQGGTALVLKWHPIFDEDGLDKAVKLYQIGRWGIFEEMENTAMWFQVQANKIGRDGKELERSVQERCNQEERFEVEK